MSTFADTYISEGNKLNGSNYVNWKFKVQTILECWNAWQIVAGIEAKLADATTAVDWDKRETKAKVLIRMSVTDAIIPHIRDCDTSSNTWKVLKTLFETENANRVFFLKSKLFSIKMDENESVNDYLSRVKELKDKLGDIGEKISSTDLVTVTLNGMTSDYQVFITSLAARLTAPTFEELTSVLLQEEERRRNLETRKFQILL
eukprot:Gb_18192 [translate_table: standard]